MTKSPFTLDSQATITSQLDAIGMHLSEFSFPNLYLFRDTHQYEIIHTPHGFFISGVTYDGKKYLMPMSSPEKSGKDCFADLSALLVSNEWEFAFPIPQEWLECFDEEDFEFNFNLNDSDYLFYAKKLKTYAGKLMHKKKNLLNQYLRNYEALLMPLTDDVLDDAWTILQKWQENSPKEMATSDFTQCAEALKLYKELGLIGAITYGDDLPTGFILGEPLNETTFTIHFAKADIAFKGVYQYLFNRFVNDFCPDYEFINMEQDMGHEGLRKTKQSYRPDLMADKYRVRLKRKG